MRKKFLKINNNNNKNKLPMERQIVLYDIGDGLQKLMIK